MRNFLHAPAQKCLRRLHRTRAVCRSGHDLTEGLRPHIARRKEPWHAGHAVLPGDDIAVRIEVGKPFEERRIRDTPDGSEHSGNGQLPFCAVLCNDKPLDMGVSQNAHGAGIQDRNNGRCRLHLRLQGAAGAECLPAVHEIHTRCDLRHVQRILKRRVTAADHSDLLPRKERPVARCAIAHAHQLRAGNVQPPVARACRIDDRPRFQHFAVLAEQRKAVCRAVDPRDLCHPERCAQRLCLFPEAVGKVKARNSRQTGVIVHALADGDHAAPAVVLFQYERCKLRPCRINCRRKPCRASPDNDQIIHLTASFSAVALPVYHTERSLVKHLDNTPRICYTGNIVF